MEFVQHGRMQAGSASMPGCAWMASFLSKRTRPAVSNTHAAEPCEGGGSFATGGGRGAPGGGLATGGAGGRAAGLATIEGGDGGLAAGNPGGFGGDGAAPGSGGGLTTATGVRAMEESTDEDGGAGV